MATEDAGITYIDSSSSPDYKTYKSLLVSGAFNDLDAREHLVIAANTIIFHSLDWRKVMQIARQQIQSLIISSSYREKSHE